MTDQQKGQIAGILLTRIPVWFLIVFAGWCFGDKTGMGIGALILIFIQVFF